MKDLNIQSLQSRIEAVLPTLNEYQRRRYLSAEAKAIGYGGISLPPFSLAPFYGKTVCAAMVVIVSVYGGSAPAPPASSKEQN